MVSANRRIDELYRTAPAGGGHDDRVAPTLLTQAMAGGGKRTMGGLARQLQTRRRAEEEIARMAEHPPRRSTIGAVRERSA